MSGLEARSTLVRSAHVVDGAGSTADGWVLVVGDTIHAVGSGAEAPAASSVDEVVDLGDAVLTPGFIDLHGHGGAGAAYDDESFASALAVHRCARHDTLGPVPRREPVPALAASLDRVRAVMADDPLVLGVHLEGPFLSPHNKGAHNESFLVAPTPPPSMPCWSPGRASSARSPSPRSCGRGRRGPSLRVRGRGRRRRAHRRHVRPGTCRVRRRSDLLTHASTPCRGSTTRRPGRSVAAVADDRVTLELILDGVHVHPSVASVLLRAAPGRVALITDAMGAAGADDGSYTLGSLAVTVRRTVSRTSPGRTRSPGRRSRRTWRSGTPSRARGADAARGRGRADERARCRAGARRPAGASGAGVRRGPRGAVPGVEGCSGSGAPGARSSDRLGVRFGHERRRGRGSPVSPVDRPPRARSPTLRVRGGPDLQRQRAARVTNDAGTHDRSSVRPSNRAPCTYGSVPEDRMTIRCPLDRRMSTVLNVGPR